jgi:hypothetical protein
VLVPSVLSVLYKRHTDTWLFPCTAYSCVPYETQNKQGKLPLTALSLDVSIGDENIKIIIYGTITLPIVLYGCETWSLTLREEHRLRIFENKVLSRIF